MSRVISWLKTHDQRMFFLINHKLNRNWIDFLMNRVTHLGGATMTILITIAIWLFSPERVSTVALQALIALAISHIPVAMMKKLYPRVRPYIKLPDVILCKRPLKDHSFPSGHTTAIFSVICPFVVAFHWLGIILIPLAALVGVSRMYLGLHYPSDVAAGCVIGCMTALFTVVLWG